MWPWATAAHAQGPAAEPPAGHTRVIEAQRVADPPAIDGRLVEASWQLGGAGEGFWVSEWRQAPTDQTRVVVLYDDTTLYVAFTCLDARPDKVRATQLTRDASPGVDDRVTVELDPRHAHRSVSRFTVTARGTPSDAIAGGRAAAFKGKWTVAAQRTPTGWTAEFAIPFAMLDLDPETDTIGVNFSRYQNRTRELSYWADVTPQRLPEEAGHLTGLRVPTTTSSRSLAMRQVPVEQPTPHAGSHARARAPSAPMCATSGAAA